MDMAFFFCPRAKFCCVFYKACDIDVYDFNIYKYIASHTRQRRLLSVGIDRETRSFYTHIWCWCAHTPIHRINCVWVRRRGEGNIQNEKIERSINSVINTQTSKQANKPSITPPLCDGQKSSHIHETIRQRATNKYINNEPKYTTRKKHDTRIHSLSVYIYNQSYAVWLRDLCVCIPFFGWLSFAAAYVVASVVREWTIARAILSWMSEWMYIISWRLPFSFDKWAVVMFREFRINDSDARTFNNY